MATPEHATNDQAHGDFHLPPNSIWPFTTALGIALLLTGLILTLVVTVVGALITIGSIAAWIRDARQEYEELPE